MDVTVEDRRSATDDALARTVWYRAFGLALQRPTLRSVEWLSSAETARVFRLAAKGLDLGGERRQALETLLAPLADLRSADALAERYDRLFGHTVRGCVCAYETEYGPENAFQQPQQLADIAGYYRAFGLQPDPAVDSRVDHVACECEFMGFLALKEAHFVEASEAANEPDGSEISETLTETRRAARSFLREHLARFGLAFAAKLAEEAGDDFFGRIGRGLALLLELDCERLAIEAGPPTLQLRPEQPDDTPMACGTGDELIQIRRRADFQ